MVRSVHRIPEYIQPPLEPLCKSSNTKIKAFCRIRIRAILLHDKAGSRILWRNLQAMKRFKLQMSTGCSGLDGLFNAMEDCFEAGALEFNIGGDTATWYDHVFSCDSWHVAEQTVKMNSNPKFFIKNMDELASMMIHDGESSKVLPRSEWNFTGWVCIDNSIMNPHWKEAQLHTDGKTFETLQCLDRCLGYFDRC